MVKGDYPAFGPGLVAFGFGLFADIAMAEPLLLPQGRVILIVSGQISRTNGDGIARLDQAMLEAMEPNCIATSTPWTMGVHQFCGVPLRSVLKSLGATGATVQATGLNEYIVSIPLTEIGPRAPFLAFQRDGSELSPHDKGPVWMIYPFDEGGAYQQDTTYARSVWQLVQIEVLP
jgi:hypothetical protein